MKKLKYNTVAPILLDVISLIGENWEIIREDLSYQYQTELEDINRIIQP